MATTNKTKKPKPVAMKKPADVERARKIRRALFHTTAAIVCIGVFAIGLWLDRGYVERKLVPSRQAAHVVLLNRPAWMSDFLAEQIAKLARPAGTHSAFDHQLLVDTVALLRANPWIREVKQVRRAYGQRPGDTLEIDCEYRAPIALVHWKDYFWLVDGDGVKLPEAFTAADVPRIVIGQDKRMNIRIIEGVKQAPPESGSKWAGADLQAGLELVKLLFGKGYTEEIVKVDVGNFAGRQDPKAAQLVLGTKYATEVRWGRPINAGDDFIAEVSPAQKLAYMQALVDERHRIDGSFPWVDIRFDNGVTYPIPGTVQTDRTEIQR